MATKAAAGAGSATEETKTAQAVENTVEAEKTAEKANTEPEAVKLVYIGPNLPKGMLQCNRIFDGTVEEIKKELAGVLEKFPLAEKMLVSISSLAEMKDKVKTSGNVYNKYYADLQAAAYDYLVNLSKEV